MDKSLTLLLQEIRQCTVCLPHLEHGVNPVVTAHPKSKVVIIGQAPGTIVHKTGIPWNDKSGERLRKWLDVGEEKFYDTELFAIVPMGFCYPGKGKSGDLAPRKECAPLWHKALLESMPEVELILLIGNYAQKYYLGDNADRTLTETVRNYKKHLPKYFPLPHPSPRNNIWLKKNEWFEQDLVPELQKTIFSLIN